jgi:L-alanine-DL-glutamate epimerase-like enolase superfamily enzyme
MKITTSQYELRLIHKFGISRNVRDTAPIVLIELEHEGMIGYGEASPSSRYGENVETIEHFISQLNLDRFSDPFNLEAIMESINSVAEGNTSAKAAVDIALHDWIGKKLGIPLYKYFGLNKNTAPLSSFTIGMDDLTVIRQKVHEAAPYPILKVKLGGDHDEEIIRTIREVTDKPIRVDANEGWKTKEVALKRIDWLMNWNIEFIEQPMPASNLGDIAWLRQRAKLPLIADENCLGLYDVPTLQQAFDGINIKLMKSTGIREAIKMIHAARACHMKVMLGCMIESAVGISAAAHIVPLCDYADLDGNVLINNDPFDGARVVEGKILIPDGPGLGVKKLK